MNLTDFPGQPYTIDFVKFYVAGKIQPTVTLTPSKIIFCGEWIIEGQISLKITGNVIDNDSIAPALSENRHETG